MALLLTIIAAVALRVYMLRGYVGLDDGEYARFAYLLAHGMPFPADYEGPAVFPLRVGLIAPVAAVFRLFGVSEWTMVVYPLAMSIAGMVLLYWCASLFFGARAGVIAAAILGAYYWDIDTSTKLLPDLPAAIASTAAVTLIAFLYQRDLQSPGRLLGGGLLAGLALGLSWLTKEAVAYLAPFCLMLMILTVRHRRSMLLVWAGVAAGALAVVLGESLTYYRSSGDPLFRLHQTERNYRQWENGFFTEGSNLGWTAGTDYRDALWDRLLVSGPHTILLDSSLYLIPFIAVIGALYGWLRRDRSFLIPSLWVGSLILMFNFSSSSLSSYIPLALYHRYLYPLFLPAIVVVAGFLAKTVFLPWHVRGPRWAGAIAILGILYTAGPYLYYGVTNRPASWLHEVRSLRSQVGPDTKLYADTLSLRAFEFFAKYPTETSWIDLAAVDSVSDIPDDSLVLVNPQYIQWLDRNAGMWLAWPAPGPTPRSGYRPHSFYEKPPTNWTRLWETTNSRLYRVGAPVHIDQP